jgi:hypothetical protein
MLESVLRVSADVDILRNTFEMTYEEVINEKVSKALAKSLDIGVLLWKDQFGHLEFMGTKRWAL